MGSSRLPPKILRLKDLRRPRQLKTSARTEARNCERPSLDL